MLPLTHTRPKPLLEVAGQSLLERQLRKLDDAGVSEIVVNVAYLGEQIVEALSTIELVHSTIHISREDSPLETGGALLHARGLLGDTPFILVNADVWCDFDYQSLVNRDWKNDQLAHLVLVANPEHNPAGDFVLGADGIIVCKSCEGFDEYSVNTFTFSGISLIHPQILELRDSDSRVFPLRDLLLQAINQGKVLGEFYTGAWVDVGTPERLEALRAAFDSE